MKKFKTLCLISFLAVSVAFLLLEYTKPFNHEIVKNYKDMGKNITISGMDGYILYKYGNMYCIRYQNKNGDLRRGMFYEWEFVDKSVKRWEEIKEMHRKINSFN